MRRLPLASAPLGSLKPPSDPTQRNSPALNAAPSSSTWAFSPAASFFPCAVNGTSRSSPHRCGQWDKPTAGGGGAVRACALARSRVRRRVMRGGEAGGRDRDGAGSGRIIGERREQSGRRGRLKCLRRRWGRGEARRGRRRCCRHCGRCPGGGEEEEGAARPSAGRCQSAGGGRVRAPPCRGPSGRGSPAPHRRRRVVWPGREGRRAGGALVGPRSCSGRPPGCRPRGRLCRGACPRPGPSRPSQTWRTGGRLLVNRRCLKRERTGRAAGRKLVSSLQGCSLMSKGNPHPQRLPPLPFAGTGRP